MPRATGQKRAARRVPFAYTAAQARGANPERTVMLSTGRGDRRLTPAEARKLAAELVAAAGGAGASDGSSEQPHGGES
jgi:hypothetical protein